MMDNIFPKQDFHIGDEWMEDLYISYGYDFIN